MPYMTFAATAATAKSLQLCPTLWDPIDGSPPGPPSLGFSRQEHWSGLPLPSPMRESEVAQSCPTLSDPMDCSLPGSSVHGIFQARVLEWGAIVFSDMMFRASISTWGTGEKVPLWPQNTDMSCCSSAYFLSTWAPHNYLKMPYTFLTPYVFVPFSCSE